MQYSQEHLQTMVYAEFGGQTESIMGNSKIENGYHANDIAFVEIFLPLFSKCEKCCRATVIFFVPMFHEIHFQIDQPVFDVGNVQRFCIWL